MVPETTCATLAVASHITLEENNESLVAMESPYGSPVPTATAACLKGLRELKNSSV